MQHGGRALFLGPINPTTGINEGQALESRQARAVFLAMAGPLKIAPPLSLTGACDVSP